MVVTVAAPVASGTVLRGVRAVGVDVTERAAAARLLRHGSTSRRSLLGDDELASFDGDAAAVFALKEALVKALRVGLFSRAAEELRVARGASGPMLVAAPSGMPPVVLGVKEEGAFAFAWALLLEASSSSPWRWALSVSADATVSSLPPLERRSCRRRLDPAASARARHAARRAAAAVGVAPEFRVRLDSRGAPRVEGPRPLPLSLAHDGPWGAALLAAPAEE